MCRREKVSKGSSTEPLWDLGVVPFILPVVALLWKGLCEGPTADLVARRHSEHVVDGEIRRGNLLACKSDLCNKGRIVMSLAALCMLRLLVGHSFSIGTK